MKKTRLKRVSAPVKIKVIYDNVPYDPDFQTGLGFSCLIQGRKNVLFDTGGDPVILKHNLGDTRVDILVLSHDHFDHTGGLGAVLRKGLPVFVGESFSEETRKIIADSGAVIKEISFPELLTDTVGSTGELYGPVNEQSLFVSTHKGLVVITGCAHPGLVDIVREAKRFTGEKIYLVMGGFHFNNFGDLLKSSLRLKDILNIARARFPNRLNGETEIMKVIKDLKELQVKKVAPSHCTGELATNLFKKEFGEDFIESGVGKQIEVT